MNRNYIKKLTAVSIALILFMTQIFSFSAASAEDYVEFRFGKVSDVSENVVAVSGKGFLGTTPSQGPDYASAIMYNKNMNPRNFESNLTFINDYGKGEGAQSGWYAVVFSKTLNWFSSVSSVIQTSEISGVVMIFKLNPNNKKQLIIELNRYSPGSGFVNIFGNAIEITLNNDWQCNVKLDNGYLKIDGQDILDLSDALNLSLGMNQNGYVGFGGFSENNYDIKMNVEYSGYTPPATPIPTPTKAPTPTQQVSVSPTPTSEPDISSEPTPGQSETTSDESSDTEISTSEDSDVDNESSEEDYSNSEPEETNAESNISETESISSDETGIDSDPEKDNGKEENSGNAIWYILIAGILVASAIGALYFYKIRKNRRN